MILPGDFVSQFVPRGSSSPGNLELVHIFEDHEVSWLIIDEMFALELETYRRCFPAQRVLSALPRYNRHKCAHLLRDLAATADLPPHSALFSQQLLDMTHRWWSEGDDNDIIIVDVLPLAAAVYVHIELRSARYPGPDPSPDPQQPRPSPHFLPGASLTTPHCCTQRGQFRELSEEYRILGSVNYELGTHTPAAWIQVFKQRLSMCHLSSHLRPFLSLVPPDVLARGAQDIADVYVREQRFTVHSRPSHVGGSAWFFSCAFWVCLQVAGVCLRSHNVGSFCLASASLNHLQFCARLLQW